MSAPLVAVCIATYRRPDGLAALLASLGVLAFDGRPPRVTVIVVDNDAAGSARAVVERAAAALRVPVVYDVEPERNISRARNRGVARAVAAGADFVAFVDDDETVRPDWLGELLAVQAASGADVVQGGVAPRFPAGSPGWLRGSWVYAVSLPARGAPLETAATNSTLARCSLLGRAPFDPDFGLSTAHDVLFFMAAGRRGARIVAAPGAVVEEDVPPGRARVRWALGRAFRVGNQVLWCERALPRPLRAPGRRLARATARMAAGVAGLAAATVLGRAGALRALCNVGYGLGCWSALAGYRSFEYRDAGR